MPTVALDVHIDSMAWAAALGFVAPMIYFIFIILSTLRLDFWLSSFTGAVAAAAVRHRDVLSSGAVRRRADARARIVYHCSTKPDHPGVRRARGRGRAPVAAAVRGQHHAAATARDRITNLFGQHVSPQVVETPDGGGRPAHRDTRRVAIMFVDFRNFTARRAAARRRRWWRGSTTHSPYWSTFWTATAAS